MRIINGYKIDEDCDIIGCSSKDYFKTEKQQFKDIIKTLLKR